MLDEKLPLIRVAASQDAIAEYKDYAPEDMAKILIICSKGGLFSGIIRLNIVLTMDESYVELIGDIDFEKDFYTRYSIEYQKFIFTHGILIIIAETRRETPIRIFISRINEE